MTQSKAPAGSSILQLSPGPVLKHQLIPQHWFSASQAGGREGGDPTKEGGKRQGPCWGPLIVTWLGTHSASPPQNQPVLCSSRAAGRGTMAAGRG